MGGEKWAWYYNSRDVLYDALAKILHLLELSLVLEYICSYCKKTHGDFQSYNMVSNTVNAQAYPLRVVTQRLTSTSSKQLPHIVAFLASTIANCQIILSRAEGQGLGKDGSDADVAVHKLKTQLSALLQDKTIEARWSAVVLIKAVIEAGGWNVLQGCGSWVRGLLTILNVRLEVKFNCSPEPTTQDFVRLD